MRKPNSIIVLLYIFHIIHPRKQKRCIQPFCFWGEHFKGLSRGPVRGVLYVPRLNFKRFHVAISEGSHVAVGISSKATDIDIDIDKFFCCDRTCIHQYLRHMQNEYPTSLKVQRQQCSASLAVVHGHWSASRFFEHVDASGVVLPYISYIGMCGPKGYGFSAVLVINRVSILADFGHFGQNQGMGFAL